MNFKKLRDIKFNRDFIIWLIGILLAYVISVLPTGVASGGLSSHIVSSISGLSIVLIILLSRIFLGERVFLTDILFSTIIIICIFSVSILWTENQNASVDKTALYLLILAPFILLLPTISKNTSDQTKAFLFSAYSGLTSGLSFVLINIAVKDAGNTFSGVFSSIYAYEYTLVSFFSGITMQAAYRHGKIINIAPVQVSLSVVFPLVCSYFVFHRSISLIQDLMIVAIAVCCWAILKKH